MTRFADLGLALDAHAYGDGSFLLRLQAADGGDLAGLGPSVVHCYRPDQPGLDRLLEFRPGETVLDLTELSAGSWVLTYTAQLDGLDLRHSLRAHRPHPRPLQGE